MATFLRLLISGLFYRAAAASTGLSRVLVTIACWTDPVPNRRLVLPVLPIVVTDQSESTDPSAVELPRQARDRPPNLYDVLAEPAPPGWTPDDDLNLGPRRPRS